MNNKKTLLITFSAIIIAIIIMMALVPQLGYIQIGLVAITLIHIPTLIGAMTFKSWKLALVSGCAFGFSSWFVAMTRPSGPVDVLFQNPLVSIVPRILFALIAFGTFVFFANVIKKEWLASLIATIISTIFHSVAVLSMMYVFGQSLFPTGYIALILTVAGTNGIIEKGLAFVIVPTVVVAVRRALKRDQL